MCLLHHPWMETRWKELIVILMKVVKNKKITDDDVESITPNEIRELIRLDPVTCMIHFNNRYRALLNILFQKEQGIFHPHKLQDYFSRLEFQMRGSPHSHGLYWVTDAPQYVEGDSESEKSCVKFIDAYITCRREETGEMEKLIKYQTHSHTNTCFKKDPLKRKCRFGFPKPPMDRTRILMPLPKTTPDKERKTATENFRSIQKKLGDNGQSYNEDVPWSDFLSSLELNEEQYIIAIRSSIKRNAVFLKRSTNACFINAYNEQLLRAWCANVDVQFVLDAFSCGKYCVAYITKCEAAVSRLLQKLHADIRSGNVSIREKLFRYAKIICGGTEISAQEAAAFLLQLPNTLSSRDDIFVNTAPKGERIHMLKSKEELKNLEKDSTDVYEKGLIDHYVHRPPPMEDICLADFATMYEFTKCKGNENPPQDVTSTPRTKLQRFKLTDGSGTMRQRGTRKILRYRHYSKLKEPGHYFREQLMLFVPWRGEWDNDNAEANAAQFAEIIRQNSDPYFADKNVDEEFLQNAAGEAEDEDCDHEESDENIVAQRDADEENACLEAEISKKSKNRFQEFLVPKLIASEEYTQLMRSLNDKQRRVVLHTLHLLKTTTQPFYYFLSGGAGVGKSHVISAIVQSFSRFHMKRPGVNHESPCVVVSAPTGMAAFNVFGMTLHCTFRLPPTQGNQKTMRDLDSSTINTLRQKLQGVKLFIIDEISMVGCRMLYQVDRRMRQIFGTNEDFGGRSVIVVGHLRQLPPVRAPNVFTPLSELAENYLWRKFEYFELDEIMRQRGEFQFCKALNNMAEGVMDEDDIRLIRSRKITPDNEPPEDAIRLYWSNTQCRNYNAEAQAKKNTEGALSVALDQVEGCGTSADQVSLLNEAKVFDQQKSDGMPYETYLKVDCIYFVSTNIDVQDGLFNGATGILRKIDYNSNNVPRKVWLEFQNPIIGNLQRQRHRRVHGQDNGNLVPIEAITRTLSKCKKGKLRIVRKQIPLVAANGMTINKAQGASMPSVVVCVHSESGKSLTRSLLYVGCSRATTLAGLYIDGEFEKPNRPSTDDEVTKEMERLRSCPLRFSLRFLQDFPSCCTKLYFHNITSFRAHKEDVLSDQSAMAANILAFVEPKLPSNYVPTLPGFTCAYHSSCRNNNSEGGLIFQKHPLLDSTTSQMSTFADNEAHCLFIEQKVNGVHLIVSYKAPRFGKMAYYTHLKNVLDKCKEEAVIFVGDINTNLSQSEGDIFRALFASFDLWSLIDGNTPTTDNGTQIDCCFSNIKSASGWVYEIYYGIHKAICVIWPNL